MQNLARRVRFWNFLSMPRAGPQPLFHNVSRHIQEKIESGEYAAGDRLPSERWFQDTLGVSRTTIRRALDELVNAGALEPRGRATYVTKEETQAPANTILSLTEMARARGLTPSARVLEQRVRPATWEEAELFSIAPGADLFELKRLRLLDGAEISLDHDRAPLRRMPSGMEIDFSKASFYASLLGAGNGPVHANLQIEARLADASERKLLDMKAEHAPVLVMTEQATNREGATVTFGRSVFRSDRHRFLASFTRTPPRHGRP